MGFENLKVSVIIPVYNGELFLRDAVESILAQTRQPVETIIVDDGSTDGSRNIALGFGGQVKYVYQKNQGPPAARNTGLKNAGGDVIGFLDADDVWPANKLEIQLPRLTAEPQIGIVLGKTQLMDKTEVVEGKTLFKKIDEPQTALKLDAALIKRSVFDRIGPFNETFRQSDDWEWFMRAREAGIEMRVHNEVTALYRRHEDNLSNLTEEGNRFILMMLKESLDRRRKQSGGKPSSLPKISQFLEKEPEGTDNEDNKQP